MTVTTVSYLYDRYDDAATVVSNLEAAGFPADDISIVGVRDGAGPVVTTAEDTSAAATGATVGGLVGGGAGLLAGLGMIAIPGIGPVVAAGWLAATLAGATTGAVGAGLIGALVDAGTDERTAQVYAEGVRRGGTLVTLRYDTAREDAALGILRAGNPVDVSDREESFRAEGWREFDRTGAPYTRRPDVTRPDLRR